MIYYENTRKFICIALRKKYNRYVDLPLLTFKITVLSGTCYTSFESDLY